MLFPTLRASSVVQIYKTLVKISVLCRLLLKVLLHFIGNSFAFFLIVFKYLLLFLQYLTNAPAKGFYADDFRTQSTGGKTIFLLPLDRN